MANAVGFIGSWLDICLIQSTTGCNRQFRVPQGAIDNLEYHRVQSTIDNIVQVKCTRPMIEID